MVVTVIILNTYRQTSSHTSSGERCFLTGFRVQIHCQGFFVWMSRETRMIREFLWNAIEIMFGILLLYFSPSRSYFLNCWKTLNRVEPWVSYSRCETVIPCHACWNKKYPKINMSPKREPFWKKISSSNHQFSGDMLVFRGVYTIYTWNLWHPFLNSCFSWMTPKEIT